MSIPPPMNNCYWRSLLSSDFFRTCYLSLCLVIQLRSDREGDIVFSLRFRFIWANNSSYLLRISYYCKTKVSFVFRHQLLFKNEFLLISNFETVVAMSLHQTYFFDKYLKLNNVLLFQIAGILGYIGLKNLIFTR